MTTGATSCSFCNLPDSRLVLSPLDPKIAICIECARIIVTAAELRAMEAKARRRPLPGIPL